ncbi:MAG: serine/threonine protein kinase [Verrucomicrobiaceae bacterium]|nr:serine/threonine protein kinase [Verrucomicrobiaceae bacterium]
MSDSRSPRRRLSGLKPEALMAQGLSADETVVEVNGIEIETPLGRGGMGAVYLGRQVSLDREVAVKVLASELADDPQFLERLEREARVMARLRHPNIVAVHDFQRTDDGAAIVMEFVEGGSLREKLQQHPKGLPVDEALRILRQIAAGLEAAHASGVIHRDMKPENVLIDADGTARVTDFGLALPLHEASTRLTLAGTAVGTVDYMAPEQFRGAEADARLDVFALGVMAYELLTGQTPRGSFDAPHRMRAGIPAHIGTAVMRALKPLPEERFPSIESFMLALNAPRRRRWLWLPGIVVLIAGALIWPREETPPPPGPWQDAAAGTRIFEDVFSGSWKNENGVLTSGPEICVVKLENDMPESYDVRMTFTRLGGVHSVALFFRCDGQISAVDLDAWGEGLAGMQEIDGRDLRAGYGFRYSLVNGERHELLVEVRPGLVRVTVDGEFKKAFDTAGKTLTITPAWEWDARVRRLALGIGSYQSPTRFEKVEWREVPQTVP